MIAGASVIGAAADHARYLLMPVLLSLLPHLAMGEQAAITIIIDDMGNHRAFGEAALDIPGDMTYAFLPHTPYAAELAEKAYASGKEIMLHLPMDASDGNGLGPGALSLHMTEAQFRVTLRESLAAIPHVAGLNNHMGSLLTRHPGAMRWLMEEIGSYQGLFFIDSRTTHETVAQKAALEHGVPNTRRDVFLDNDRDPAAIRGQFRLLLAKARQQGYAVGIGHPYPETVSVLSRLLSELKSQGIRLISASEMVDLQQRREPWHVPSSPSPRVAKNSKQ